MDFMSFWSLNWVLDLSPFIPLSFVFLSQNYSSIIRFAKNYVVAFAYGKFTKVVLLEMRKLQ